MKHHILICNLIKTKYISGDDFEYGTGIIIPSQDDEYDYIFTALHCVKGKEANEDGKFEFYNYKKQKVELYDSIIYQNESLDVAIVKIQKIIDSNCIDIKFKYSSAQASIIGFPEHIECNFDEEEIDVKFNDNKNTVKVESGQIHIGRNDVKSILGGLSGSPVLIKEQSEYYVAGFLSELEDPKFAYQNIIYTDISEYLKVIDENDIAEVKKNNINIVELCITSIKPEIEDMYKNLYSRIWHYANEIKEISFEPYINWLKEKLYLPYNRNKGFDKEAGVGLIKYLTYLYIISNQDFIDKETKHFDEKKFFEYIKDKREEGLKYFYSYESRELVDVIPIIYLNDEVFGNVKYNDVVITSFENNNIKRDKILHSEVPNIVPNIFNGKIDDDLYDRGMDIASPEVNKNVDILHISYFENILVTNWNYANKPKEIDKYIEEKISEAIRSVM